MATVDPLSMAAESTASDRAGTQWSVLQRQVAKADKRRSPSRVFGEMAESGAVYRWGIAASTGREVSPLEQTLSRMAVDDRSWVIDETAPRAKSSPKSGTRMTPDGLREAAEWFADGSHSFAHETSSALGDVNERLNAVLWAGAMPGLMQLLPETLWWDVLGRLQWLAVTHQQPGSQPLDAPEGNIGLAARWLHAAEIAMTLAWRLASVPSCARLAEPACETVLENLDGTEETVEDLTANSRSNRLMLASILRCERLVSVLAKKRFRKAQRNTAWELAVWTAAMTRHDGTTYLSPATAKQTNDDATPATLTVAPSQLPKRGRAKERAAKHMSSSKPLSGLFAAACRYEEESLRPSFEAALGARQTGGRLAWEVSLPDAMWHGERSGQVALMPQWDVRRGRVFLDYRGDSIQMDLWAGRRAAL